MLAAIIKTAILGTERSFPEKILFPTFLHDTYDEIMRSDISKEAKFLRLSAYTFQIQQTATKSQKHYLVSEKTPQEERPHASEKANFMFRNFLKKENKLLVIFGLRMFEKAEKLVSPYEIPALLDLAYTKMEWRATIVAVCGKRAEWLSQFNIRWKPIFDLEANAEKLIKKSEKQKKTTMETAFAGLSTVQCYALIDTYLSIDSMFYHYLDALMNENFTRFPADFSLKIFQEINKRYCGQSPDFYQNIALHLHSSLKSELLEQTNQSFQNTGIHPNIAREMLENLMDRDDFINAL
jgi:hypothetical protein